VIVARTNKIHRHIKYDGVKLLLREVKARKERRIVKIQAKKDISVFSNLPDDMQKYIFEFVGSDSMYYLRYGLIYEPQFKTIIKMVRMNQANMSRALLTKLCKGAFKRDTEESLFKEFITNFEGKIDCFNLTLHEASRQSCCASGKNATFFINYYCGRNIIEDTMKILKSNRQFKKSCPRVLMY
jgi:hypothetical protein